MLRMLHRIAARGRVYDWIQSLAGARQVQQRLKPWLAGLPGTSILDIGGGTGSLQALVPPGVLYAAMDIEQPKLRQFRLKNPSGLAILADATRMPIRDKSIHLAVCVDVSHHLSDSQFAAVLSEVKRVLTVDGKFVFLDAMWQPTRWAGRLLWALDRGSAPKTSQQINDSLSTHFNVQHSERFRIYHEYLLAIANPR